MAEDRGAFTAATGRQLEAAGRDKPRYRRYQYDLIAPHCGRTILEVGAGLGEFAEQFDDVEGPEPARRSLVASGVFSWCPPKPSSSCF